MAKPTPQTKRAANTIVHGLASPIPSAHTALAHKVPIPPKMIKIAASAFSTGNTLQIGIYAAVSAQESRLYPTVLDQATLAKKPNEYDHRNHYRANYGIGVAWVQFNGERPDRVPG